MRKVPEAFTMDPVAFEEEYNVKKPDKNDDNNKKYKLGVY